MGAIAAEFGTYREAIRRVLVVEGVPLRRTRPSAPVDRDALADAHRAGESARSIARRHGLSLPLVVDHLAAAGVLRRRGNPGPDVDLEEVVRRRDHGESLVAIARDLGVTEATLAGRLQRAGKRGGPPRLTQAHLAAAWRDRLPGEAPDGVSDRDWRIFRRVVGGEHAREVARDVGLSAPRVGQIVPAVDAALQRERDVGREPTGRIGSGPPDS